MRSSPQSRHHMLRYLMISVVFCAVCVFYLGSLFYVQISGRQNSYQPPTKKTVSIPAVRGEIFDRNGKENPAYKVPVIRQNNKRYAEIRIPEGYSAAIIRK